MKRLISAFLLTVILGMSLYFGYDLIKNKIEKTDNKDEDIKYIFNVDFAKTINVGELISTILNNEEFLLFIGSKDDQSSAKMSTYLNEIIEDYDIDVYYLDGSNDLVKNEEYIKFVNKYERLDEYGNFSPVLLVFRNNEFIAGYPGDANYRNLYSFFMYSEVIKGVDSNE